MYNDASQQTEAILGRHLRAFANGDVDAIINDYTDESVLFTPGGTVRGLTQLRKFYDGILTDQPGYFLNFDMMFKDVEGDVGFIVWFSDPEAPMGTDTFVVRDGKIVTQTFRQAQLQ